MANNVHSISDLYQYQALPLNIKIAMTKRRIRDWVNEFGESGVYVSFSGGKDSTVLLHIAREMYPEIKAVYVDTGLEYPEIRQFVKTFDNVDWVRPKKHFKQVCEEYGFPIISKEVSECVYGARKYLTSILESESVLTDRQTDRPWKYAYERITGTGRYKKKEITLSELADSIPNEEKHLATKDTQNLLGWRRKDKGLHEPFVDNIALTNSPSRGGTTTSIVNLEELANILNNRMINKEGGNNQRLAIMLGMLTKDKNHPIKANIPSKDRSQFSQERWKFMLDAPFEISNRCCNIMKKEPVHRYEKQTGRQPITAQMASESKLRTQKWLANGCNAFDSKHPISNPLSFWVENDILLYIKTYEKEIMDWRRNEYFKVLQGKGLSDMDSVDSVSGLTAKELIDRDITTPIASVYGDIVVDYQRMGQVEGQMSFADFMDAEEFDLDRPLLKTTGCNRTGCVLCAYGCHLEKGESRFERLKKTHPKHYALLDKMTNSGVTYREAIDWINEHNGKGTIIRY